MRPRQLCRERGHARYGVDGVHVAEFEHFLGTCVDGDDLEPHGRRKVGPGMGSGMIRETSAAMAKSSR